LPIPKRPLRWRIAHAPTAVYVRHPLRTSPVISTKVRDVYSNVPVTSPQLQPQMTQSITSKEIGRNRRGNRGFGKRVFRGFAQSEYDGFLPVESLGLLLKSRSTGYISMFYLV